MDGYGLSVVVPVFNEGAGLEALVQRCLAALATIALPCELIVVDDASTDGTRAVLARLGTMQPRLRPLHLDRNRGQYQATCEGLRAARGALVIVLDGDLQDPPEVIPALVTAWSTRTRDLDAVVAVKFHRDDPSWLRLGSAVLGGLQQLFGRGSLPHGAGSFCLLRADMAREVACVPLRDVNLGAVLAARGVRHGVVPYAKAARVHGATRVGAWGLVREALGSLVLTGALPRALGASSVALAVVGVGVGVGVVPCMVPCVALALAAVCLGVASQRLRRALRNPLWMNSHVGLHLRGEVTPGA